MTNRHVITIDGPAGAGKSSVARALADRLEFQFLDTGAMYRAVALMGIRLGVDWDDADAVAKLAEACKISFQDDSVFLDGEDVSTAIRDADVTSVTRFVADNPDVRQRLVQLQQELAKSRDSVTEGRDQGTVAFPQADCKIFLTASPEERARRRLKELRDRGDQARLEEVLDAQNARDARDQTRKVGRLTPAADAIEVISDNMTLDQVVDRLERIARQRLQLD